MTIPSNSLPLALAWIAAVAVWPQWVVAESPMPLPNIIVVLVDDLGYADVGFHGCRDIPTPHLDRLANSGVRCSAGYVSHPFCSPTRAGLLTGRYQQRFGHENNPAFLPDNELVGLPTSERTLAEILRTSGYATGAVGKWHLGAADCFHPLNRGFAEYFGLLGGGHDYFLHNLYWTNPMQAKAEYRIPLQRQKQPVEEHEYLTDAIAREAVAFIDRHQSIPFFLYLAFNAPHTPLQAKPSDLGRVSGIADEKRRTYAAMVVAVDDAIGRLLQKLQETQRDDETLIFFLSDNGGPTAVSHCSNGVLRGAKGQVYEGGIRVPFVVRWPNRLPAGGAYAFPVSSLDIFPTALAAARIPVSQAKPLDGVDLLPHLGNESLQPPHDILYWRTGGGLSFAVRQSAYKLIGTDGRTELYDLEKDPSEIHNLADEKPDVTRLLRKHYDDWNAQLVRPLWQSPQGGKQRKKAKS